MLGRIIQVMQGFQRLNWTKVGLKLNNIVGWDTETYSLNWTKVGLKFAPERTGEAGATLV